MALDRDFGCYEGMDQFITVNAGMLRTVSICRFPYIHVYHLFVSFAQIRLDLA